MKAQYAIRKLERDGFTVTVTSIDTYNGMARQWRAQKDGSNRVIELLRNGIGDDLATIRVRDRTDGDDIARDYCAGVFVPSVTRAMRLAAH